MNTTGTITMSMRELDRFKVIETGTKQNRTADAPIDPVFLRSAQA
ncbi:hypothetical protein AWB81_08161 [Caballeronia arationis]|nr:hypothetical protein [Caballeronia arationis]SAL07563.1 hypothetical protein AWB81_08161 [Caballeronia arationis]